jgi:hypothetical protein
MRASFVPPIAVLLAFVLTPHAWGAFVDEFNGASLDPAWGAIQTNPVDALPGTISGHNAAVSGGTFNISNMAIDADVTIGNVYVERNVASMTSGSFRLTMDFAAHSGPDTDYGYVTAGFLDASDDLVLGGGWFDNQLAAPGATWMANTGSTPAQGQVFNGPPTQTGNPLPFSDDGFGRLILTRLNNTLSVDSGFVPTAEFTNYDSIPITNRRRTAPANLNAIADLQLRFHYLRLDSFPATYTPLSIDRVSLEEITSIPGDVDGDLDVDMDDYTVLQQNIFTTVTLGSHLGDLNADAFVDFADFRLWKQFFPGGSGAAEAAIAGLGAPEPGTLSLLISVALAVGSARRRRRN